MKTSLAIISLFLATSAFAQITLHQKMGLRECSVTNNKVTITYVMNKGALGFTTTRSFEGYGYEELVKKAASLSTQREPQFEMEAFVKIDGEKFVLSEGDSKEAGTLMTFIGNICR